MLSRQSPPMSTPLEPCRIAPYVSLGAIRGVGNSGCQNAAFKHTYTSIADSSDNINGGISASLSVLCLNSGKSTNPAFDPATITASTHKYTAVMGNENTVSNMFAVAQYRLNFAAVAAAQSKNSSIADLRMKAKRHAESLGLDTHNEN